MGGQRPSYVAKQRHRRGRQRGRVVATRYGEIVTDQHPDRQVGWVTTPTQAYVRPVGRIAVRWMQKTDQWAYAVIRSTVIPQEVVRETGQPPESIFDHHAVLLAYVYGYDACGSGVETA